MREKGGVFDYEAQRAVRRTEGCLLVVAQRHCRCEEDGGDWEGMLLNDGFPLLTKFVEGGEYDVGAFCFEGDIGEGTCV